jgi:hypothetical protein
MSESKRSLAAAYSGHARSRAEKTSTALVLWTVALLYVWAFGLEPYHQQYQKRQAVRREKAAFDTVIAVKRDKLLANHGLIEGTATGPAEKDEYDAVITRELTKPRKQRQSLIEPAAEAIAFKIPPGVEFPVPAAFAPLIWSAFLVLLLAYVAHQRMIVLRYCARALRVYRQELKHEVADCADVLCNMPIWLAPLPVSGSHVSPDDFASALGWRMQRGTAMWLVPFAFAVLLLVQTRVSYFGYVVAADVHSYNYALRALSVAALLSVALIIAWWLARRKIPDEWGAEPEAAVWTRRQAALRLASVIAAATAAPAIIGFTQSVRGRSTRNPRYRRSLRAFVSSLAPGFYIRQYSERAGPRTIHYVDYAQRVQGVITLAENMMQPVQIEIITQVHHLHRPYPRIQLSTASSALEEAALKAVRSGRYSDAVALLRSSVEHDLLLKSSGRGLSRRAHDLLAGLSIRYESGHAGLTWLIKTLQAVGPHAVDAQRIQKWQNAQSKWRRMWSNRSAPVKWSGLLM